MEEIQKTTKKTATSKKVSSTKTEEVKTRKASSTAKAPKATKTTRATEKEPKATRTSSTSKETKKTKTATTSEKPKTTKSSTTKKATMAKEQTKTVKAQTTTKQPKKTTNIAKEVKTSTVGSAKKVAKSPNFTVKKEIKEEVKNTNINDEPTLIILHEKSEAQQKVIQPVQKEKIRKEKNTKKPKKGYIEISIGAIVCAIIIFLLLVFNVKLGVRAYNVITNNQKANTNLEVENDESVTQEVGNILDNDNEIVLEMQEKITFPTNVIASIYNKETFNVSTIPNNLKLMMGWAKTKDEDKLKSINEKNKQVEAIEKETIKESIKDIFGENAKYRNESFYNTEISTFASSSKNQGTITYSNGLYTSITNQTVENGMKPLIYQEIQKVVKYSETVIVHVKVAYMDAKEGKYIVYKDFSDDKFEEKILELTKEELFQNESFDLSTGEGTVTVDANAALDSVRSQLYTYKYTFELDEVTGEYYLSKFNKSLDIE